MLAVQAAELVVRQAESLGGPPLMVAALGQGPLQHLDFEPGDRIAERDEGRRLRAVG